MSLAGTWYNELDSKMQLSIASDETTISGTYQTAVGQASGLYSLSGYCDPQPDQSSTAIGFTVLWNNTSGDSNSVTTWSGQYQVINGLEMITAFWLLTQETDPADNWKSTLVGEDSFTRDQHSAERIARRQARGPAPHPRSAASN